MNEGVGDQRTYYDHSLGESSYCQDVHNVLNLLFVAAVREPLLKGLSTFDLLVKISCFWKCRHLLFLQKQAN